MREKNNTISDFVGRRKEKKKRERKGRKGREGKGRERGEPLQNKERFVPEIRGICILFDLSVTTFRFQSNIETSNLCRQWLTIF